MYSRLSTIPNLLVRYLLYLCICVFSRIGWCSLRAAWVRARDTPSTGSTKKVRTYVCTPPSLPFLAINAWVRARDTPSTGSTKKVRTYVCTPPSLPFLAINAWVRARDTPSTGSTKKVYLSIHPSSLTGLFPPNAFVRVDPDPP